jgi:hypothetical protein
MMNVPPFHDDVVEGRNVVHDTKHHSTHRGEGQEETDGGDKQTAPRTISNAFPQKKTQTGAAKEEEQGGRRRQENWQENPIEMQTHGALELARGVNGKPITCEFSGRVRNFCPPAEA